MSDQKDESGEESKEGFRWFWQSDDDKKKEKRDRQRKVVESEQETIVASLKELPSWVRNDQTSCHH